MLNLLPAPVSHAVLDGPGLRPADLTAVSGPGSLTPPIERAARLLYQEAGLVLQTIVGADGASNTTNETPGGARPAIRLRVEPGDPRWETLTDPLGVSPRGDDPALEQYALVAGPTGIEVVGRGEPGVLAGLTTAVQLVSQAARAGSDIGPIQILDGPLLAWRGLSLDVVRTFFTVGQVCQVLDMMARYKLNVLHLHLTDDQGWRLEIPRWPALTEVGARGAIGQRPGGFYTAADFAAIVNYATGVGITVVPEIEMPGHAGAALRAYPQLAPQGDGHGYFDPTNQDTYRFISEVLATVSDLSPSPFLHLGGDEAMGLDPAGYQEFWRTVMPLARATGKRLALWQEGSRGAVGNGDLVQVWIGFDPGAPGELSDVKVEGMEAHTPQQWASLMEIFAEAPGDAARALDAGARLILSPSRHLYLDTRYAEDATDAAGTGRARGLGAPFYPSQSVRQFYEWSLDAAVPGVSLGPDVAGVEAAIWCETVTSLSDLQFLLLPRLPGVGEHAWNGARAPWGEYRERLAAQEPCWQAAGWDYFRSRDVW